MEKTRQQFRMIIIVLSFLLILVFAALFASNVVYADPEPTYTVTIKDYDNSTLDVSSTIDTLSNISEFLYSDIQINEDTQRYSYSYYYYDSTAENHLGALINPQDEAYSLSEDVTIVQFSQKIASQIQIVSETLSVIDTIYVASISYSDFAQYEEAGYEYEYYWYDDSQTDKKGAFIATNTQDYSVISNDEKIIQVKNEIQYTVSIYIDSFSTTPIAEKDAYYGASLKPILESEEDSGYYYVYLDKDCNLMPKIDISIESDLKVLRLPAYWVELYFSEEGSASSSIWYSGSVAKNTTFDISSKFTQLSDYDYLYYATDQSEGSGGKGTLLPSPVVSLMNIEAKYVKNEKIKLIYTRMHCEYILSNSENDHTKTVVYSKPYGTLFTAPTKDGYTFKEWQLESGEVITADTIVNIKEDHKIIAIYTPNEYTITYVLNNGEANKTETIVFNNKPKGCIPQKTGYTYDGYTQEDNTIFDFNKAYDIPGDVKLYARWKANAYDLTFTINGQEQVYSVNYDNLNITINTDKLMEFKTNYYILGMYYFDGEGKAQVLTQFDLLIPHWSFAENLRAYIIAVPKASEFTTNLPLTTFRFFKHKIEIDGKMLEPESEEDVSATILINTIGYHTIRILDSTKTENNVVQNYTITIKEDLGIETGDVYDKPIVLKEIVGKVYIDGEEVDPAKVRIEKQGTYTIEVKGENDYTSTYVVEYINVHIIEAWALFGISGGLFILVLLLVIIGRRRVIRYDRD